jgi:anti-anti-sigma factor
MMNIEPTQLDKAVLLKVSGRMDAENAIEFEKACEVWISQGSKHVIADLNELKYVSSMGLRSFLAVAQTLRSKSGSLIFCGLQGLPRQVFEMTRLIDLFPVYETAQQALATLP